MKLRINPGEIHRDLVGVILAAILNQQHLGSVRLCGSKIKDLPEGIRQALFFIMSRDNQRKKGCVQVVQPSENIHSKQDGS